MLARAILVILWLIPAAAAATTRAASRPSTPRAAMKPATRRHPGDADRAAVRAAVNSLSAEYERHVRDSEKVTLRSSSNYFKDHPAEDLTDEAILDELVAPFPDARQAAYVRWQLLSGLKDADGTRLLAAYRAAPLPPPRLGMAPHDQQKLDRLVQGKRASDEMELKRQFDAALETAQKADQPILAYRDELYHRSSKTFDTFAVAMEDLNQRLNAVAEAKALIKLLATDVKDWAGSENPPPQQIAALASAARTLADSKSPQYYVSPYWRERGGVFAWRKSRSGIDEGQELKKLAEFLDDLKRQPAINLESKTTKET